MARLRLFSGREIIQALGKIGYRTAHQRGSHIRLVCEGKRSVTVPNYDLIGHGLLRKILRDAELSSQDFIKLLERL